MIDRFKSKYKVDVNTGCWEWTAGSYNNKGYGSFWLNGSCKLAHRVSYELFKGSIGELSVCHLCDNPKCVNPDHLFLGSQDDNVKDMVMKGRVSKKLSYYDVKAIRMLYKQSFLTQKELANEFNVSAETVSGIVRRSSWRWVE
jgi:hypothetical protein